MPVLPDLIIVIPGIGGSTLETPAGKPVWGPGLGEISTAVLRDVSRIDIGESLRPVGVLPTIGILPWMKVPGYDRLEKRLRDAFDLKDADVDVSRDGVTAKLRARLVFFPYDFRHSVDSAGERLAWDVKRRLAAIGGNARAIVIGHSMGGLVARWWWARGGYEVCRRLITVGTPHRGAPKALDWLINGVRLGSGTVERASRQLLASATEVVRGWPSVYDLLPRYPAVHDGTSPLYPHELPIAIPGFVDGASQAYQRHLDLEGLCTPLAARPAGERPELFAIYSRGHPTLARATMLDGVVALTKDDAEWLPNRGWLGDGTIPAISAIPIEHSEGARIDRFRLFAPEPHVELGSSSTLVEHLISRESDSLATVRGDEAISPWIGFDVDDVVEVGSPVCITVRQNGLPSGTVNRVMLSIATPGDKRFGAPVALERDTLDWSVIFVPPREGVYRIRATMDRTGLFGPITGHDAFGAFEP